MDLLTAIFSHLCGQKHVFTADGAALVVCQRCLGMYVGAALTAGWLAGSGLWRRGLASWGVFLAQEAAILLAMLGGVHVWGHSPTGRVLCGLWTGHVVLAWLVGGGGHLWRLARRPVSPQLPWRRGDKLQAAAGPMVLVGVAWLTPHAMGLGWTFWSLAAAVGAAALAAGLVLAGGGAAAYAAARIRGARAAARPGEET
jgi:polyferredoxin